MKIENSPMTLGIVVKNIKIKNKAESTQNHLTSKPGNKPQTGVLGVTVLKVLLVNAEV